MAVGKRLSTEEPLTEHDIAARLEKAVLRVVRIMWDARQLGLHQQVHRSRFLPANTLGMLRAELDEWGIEPQPLAGQHEEVPDA